MNDSSATEQLFLNNSIDLSYRYQNLFYTLLLHNLSFTNMNNPEQTVMISDDDNNDNGDDKVQFATVTNPPYHYICHTNIQKIYIFECELQWRCVRDNGNITSDVTVPSIVTTKKARLATREVEPLYPSNKDVAALLTKFSRAFLYGLVGLKEMFPENGIKGTCTQHRWYREFVPEGIVQLERCEIPHILSMNRDHKVYEMIPALENYWFSALVDNLLRHMHFAIAYDVNTDAKNPDGNYHVVVRHGKVHVQGNDTSYYVYGNEPEDQERNLIH